MQTAKNVTLRLIRDYGLAILVATGVALLIRSMVFEAYRLPSDVMRPALFPGDLILVAKWPYGIRPSYDSSPWISGRPPRAGEVVVYSPPDDPRNTYIRRVMAVAGEWAGLSKGRLVLNHRLLEFIPGDNAVCGREVHPKSHYEICLEPPLLEDYEERQVPPGSVFVAGDLRTQNSKYKRGHGIVPISSIRAEARWVWYSVDTHGNLKLDRMFKSIRGSD